MSPTTGEIGTQLISTYLLPFEVAGVVLLVALTAATLLTRSEPETTPDGGQSGS